MKKRHTPLSIRIMAAIVAAMMLAAPIAPAAAQTAATAPAQTAATAPAAPCKAPSPPINKAFRPYLPSCIIHNAAANTYTCSCGRAECNRFKSDLDDYNADIAEYVKALELYVTNATKYATCKVNEINRENAP